MKFFKSKNKKGTSKPLKSEKKRKKRFSLKAIKLKKRGFSLKHMKIGSKLFSGFTIVIFLIIAMAALSVYNLQKISYQINILEKTTEANLYLERARVEQVRFEENGSQQTANEVKELLGKSKETIITVGQLMKPKQGDENAIKMLNSVQYFEDKFDVFLELEGKKVEQEKASTVAARRVIDSIRNSLIYEESYIIGVYDSAKLKASFGKYLVIQDAFDAYMEVRIVSYKYVSSESNEHAEQLKNLVSLTKVKLKDAMESIKDTNVLNELGSAIKALDTYMAVFEDYNKLVEIQKQQQLFMHDSSKSATNIAADIQNEISEVVENLEVKTAQLNLILTILVVLLSMFVAFAITRSIVKPLKSVLVNIDALSKYDLRHDVEDKYLNRKDEIGLLATAINEINQSLRAIVNNISENALAVLTSSGDLSSTSQVTAGVANEIASTVGEIADGATEQAKNTEEGVWSIDQLGGLMKENQGSVEDLITAADKVTMLKDDGLSVIKSLVEETGKSNEATGYVYEIIQETNTSATKIESASQMIKNIANQTNLLALNAAIEAARAGDAGKGFAVVADEIRKLAEQSTAFTLEISDTIQELMAKASQAVRTMEEASEIVLSQSNNVRLSSEKFQGISDAVEAMKSVIVQIQSSSDKMHDKEAELVEVMGNLSSISEENAAGSEEVSASIEEQTASIAEVSESSIELAKLAEEMQLIISRFKI